MISLSKKFRGWILPEHFTPDHQHASQFRHTSFLGPVLGMRSLAHVIIKPTLAAKEYVERIVYVGCVHGGNEKIYERLERLLSNPPDYLIFAGDMTGSPEIEALKKEFYDYKDWMKEHQGRDAPHLSFASDSDIGKFEYFGEWAATLPEAKRDELLGSIYVSAEKLVKIMEQIKKKGTKIIMVEGNWDNPMVSGLKYLAGNDIQRVFDTRKFYATHGFKFVHIIEAIETKTTLQILIPYITLLHFDLLGVRKRIAIQRQIGTARSAGKSIILVAHAEANWRMHHLQQADPEAHGDRHRVIHHFGQAIGLFQPDEVIYPHQHARIRNEEGTLVPIDTKYMLEITKEGVHLIDTPDILHPEKPHTLATYIPFGYMAEEVVT